MKKSPCIILTVIVTYIIFFPSSFVNWYKPGIHSFTDIGGLYMSISEFLWAQVYQIAVPK